MACFRRRSVDDKRLLFATVYDGDRETCILEECEGRPGLHDHPKETADFIAAHQATADGWYSAYPDASVNDIRRAQRITRAFDNLLDEAQE